MYPCKDVYIAIIKLLELPHHVKSTTINYIAEHGKRDLVERFESDFSPVGFSWSSSPQGADFWCNSDLSRKYESWVRNTVMTVQGLMSETIPFPTPNDIATYEETNLDRVLYFITRVGFYKSYVRLIRKDLKQLQKKGLLNVRTNYDKNHMIVNDLFTWSLSTRYHRSIEYQEVHDSVRSFIRNHANAYTLPIPHLQPRIRMTSAPPIPSGTIYGAAVDEGIF